MMIKNVIVSKEAANDLEDGRSFYDQRQAGVGDYFWDSLISDMESLSIFSGIHSRQHGLFRMLSKRFPYAIYYESDNDTAFVIAVLPMRRDPIWLEAKINNRSNRF